jgi:hypothetical protein
MPALNLDSRERRGRSHRQVHLEIILQVMRSKFNDLGSPCMFLKRAEGIARILTISPF